MTAARARISMVGASGLLVDLANGVFDQVAQQTIWAMSKALLAIDGVREAVPGMNNLLVVFDPLVLASDSLESAICDLVESSQTTDIAGRMIDIPVVYGGADGEDLIDLASHCGLEADEVVRRHSNATYRVAAVGAMPGFPYLSGLDPSLEMARRASPRMVVAEGSVIIGGAQAGIMPITAPSGWHIIGRTDLKLFDPSSNNPTLLLPGDSVRFIVSAIAA